MDSGDYDVVNLGGLSFCLLSYETHASLGTGDEMMGKGSPNTRTLWKAEV